MDQHYLLAQPLTTLIHPYYQHSLRRKALVPLPGCCLDYLDRYLFCSKRNYDELKKLSRYCNYRVGISPGARKSLDSITLTGCAFGLSG